MMQQSWSATMASSILDSLVHTVKTAEISVLQIYSPLWAKSINYCDFIEMNWINHKLLLVLNAGVTGPLTCVR